MKYELAKTLASKLENEYPHLIISIAPTSYKGNNYYISIMD